MNPSTDLKTIRETIRTLRKAIPPSDRAAATAKICERFRDLKAYQNAQMVGGFLAFDGEADPLGIMVHACKMEKKVFVPIIVARNKPLMFSPWTPQTAIRTNRFGIAEPVADPIDYVEARELDFVITPLVAFDDQCQRVGVGGGYYDRTFQFLNENKNRPRQTRMVGFALELQRVESVDHRPWDVVLDNVVTEWRVYQCAAEKS